MDSRRGGQVSNAPLESESDGAIVSRLAQQDNVPWYRKPNLRLLYLLMIPTCLGVQLANGFDVSVISGLQAVSSWLEYYHYPRSAELGLMASMDALGALATLPFVSFAVDKFGRRSPILIGGICSTFGGILQGASLNFTMFVVARFFRGLATMVCIVAGSSLIGELSHPKERATMGGLFSGSYYLGAIVAASITLGTFSMDSNWGWRIPSFVSAVPSLLQLIFIGFIPESPRWLISKGRGSEAYAILVKYHAEGDGNSEFVKAEYNQIEQTLEEEMKASEMSWSEVFSTSAMRKRAVIGTALGLFNQWSGLGLIGYYLAVILDGIGMHDNQTKNIVNLARFAWSFVNGTIIAFIVPRYPRRNMFLACTISIFVVFGAWTVANAEYSLTQSKVAAQVVFALIFLYSPAYNLAFTALTYPYLVEIFPFHVRAKGITIFQLWSCVGAFSNQFLNPIGIDTMGWKWYIVYCVWIAFEIVFVYIMFPETSGRTLEELTFLFEGDHARGNPESEPLLHTRREADAYGRAEGNPRQPIYGQQR